MSNISPNMSYLETAVLPFSNNNICYICNKPINISHNDNYYKLCYECSLKHTILITKKNCCIML